MYNFFALLGRMKYINRWSLMRSTQVENIAEHSHTAAVIAHTLGVINNIEFGGDIDADRLAVYAVYHEVSEVITGDLPTPIKYFNPTISKAYKELESYASDKLIKYLPPSLQGAYRDVMQPDLGEHEKILLKSADKICALIKCIEEQKAGNKEFDKARQKIERELEQTDVKEVDFFLKNFLPAYELTLDEIN